MILDLNDIYLVDSGRPIRTFLSESEAIWNLEFPSFVSPIIIIDRSHLVNRRKFTFLSVLTMLHFYLISG